MFLIPFEIVGVVLACGFLVALFQDSILVSLVFAPDEIQCTRRLWCFKKQKKWNVSEASKIQICGASEDCEVQFLDSADELLCVIDSLKLEDARWLAAEQATMHYLSQPSE
ncbi:MAG: hypothetical protein Q4D38_08475 [Planctomycetia bacterium]|nr:hypothetical protein [Planctomycetia bacterium]